MSLAQRLIPKRLQERAQPFVDRFDTLLREFEWTWTKACVAALILWFLAITFIGVIPSWWLYRAGRPAGSFLSRWIHLPWTPDSFWLYKLRDLVAVILFSVPTGAFLVLPYRVQNRRRKLRGADASRAAGGYR
jgi:hypothetical protein